MGGGRSRDRVSEGQGDNGERQGYKERVGERGRDKLSVGERTGEEESVTETGV